MSNEEYICENSKCKIGGISDDVIFLPVSITDLPEQIEIEGNILYAKKEFHVSLVCIRRIADRYNINIPDFLNKIISDFREFNKENKVELLHYNNDFRFAVRDDLKTVIVTCEVSNINKFFDLMNKKYGVNVEYPSTHVTLYTLKDKVGIYLIDSSDIKNLTVTIENPVGRIL